MPSVGILRTLPNALDCAGRRACTGREGYVAWRSDSGRKGGVGRWRCALYWRCASRAVRAICRYHAHCWRDAKREARTTCRRCAEWRAGGTNGWCCRSRGRHPNGRCCCNRRRPANGPCCPNRRCYPSGRRRASRRCRTDRQGCSSRGVNPRRRKRPLCEGRPGDCAHPCGHAHSDRTSNRSGVCYCSSRRRGHLITSAKQGCATAAHRYLQASSARAPNRPADRFSGRCYPAPRHCGGVQNDRVQKTKPGRRAVRRRP